MLRALYEVVSKAGANMSETSRAAILGLIDSDAVNSSSSDNSAAITNARLLGALIKNLPPGEANPLIKYRALSTRHTPSSVLNLNSILLDSPASLVDNFATETPAVIAAGIASKNPFISDNAVLAAGKYLLHTASAPHAYESSKPLISALASAIAPGNPVDTRRLALVVIRTLSRHHPLLLRPHLPLLAPPLFASVRDPVIPVKLAAEAAFVSVFDIIDSESAIFDKYIIKAEEEGSLPAAQKRSMGDYFKRVGLRLAAQARERKEAGGGVGSLGGLEGEEEDEREVWSVGRVELEGDGGFGDE